MQIRVVHLGEVDYKTCLQTMRERAKSIATSYDHELWVCSHASVYTLGQAANREHLLDVPEALLVQADRGGQVTWHGPGQIIFYPLLHLASLGLGPKKLVHSLEQTVINVLAELGVDAHRCTGAPGVYVADAKIASVGLRICKGVSYHGLALNHHNQLAPFDRINPCGFRGMRMTRVVDLCQASHAHTVQLLLQQLLLLLKRGNSQLVD